MEDVRLKPMIPKRFFGKSSRANFLARLPAVDPLMQRELLSARKEGKVLRFLAEIDPSGCSVGLKKIPKDSPVGRLAGPDNILVFKTARYLENPLVIQGPGAGASVTAAGVLSDLLKIAKWI
jgi:aspartokinase/homoserine dehydrogenase 1